MGHPEITVQIDLKPTVAESGGELLWSGRSGRRVPEKHYSACRFGRPSALRKHLS